MLDDKKYKHCAHLDVREQVFLIYSGMLIIVIVDEHICVESAQTLRRLYFKAYDDYPIYSVLRSSALIMYHGLVEKLKPFSAVWGVS